MGVRVPCGTGSGEWALGRGGGGRGGSRSEIARTLARTPVRPRTVGVPFDCTSESRQRPRAGERAAHGVITQTGSYWQGAPRRKESGARRRSSVVKTVGLDHRASYRRKKLTPACARGKWYLPLVEPTTIPLLLLSVLVCLLGGRRLKAVPSMGSQNSCLARQRKLPLGRQCPNLDSLPPRSPAGQFSTCHTPPLDCSSSPRSHARQQRRSLSTRRATQKLRRAARKRAALATTKASAALMTARDHTPRSRPVAARARTRCRRAASGAPAQRQTRRAPSTQR